MPEAHSPGGVGGGGWSSFAFMKAFILKHPVNQLTERYQCSKKVVSNSLGLVDFPIGLVTSVFNLPDGQVMFLRNSNNRRTMKSILLVKKLLGLVEMTSGLVNASFSLPKLQAVDMIFFAPWVF